VRPSACQASGLGSAYPKPGARRPRGLGLEKGGGKVKTMAEAAKTREQPLDTEATDERPFHPEEMKGTVRLNFGKFVEISATGRTTPAGLISVALLLSAVLIPLAIIARGRR
jgi:hypothetical protein